MSILLKCGCGKQLQVRDELAGKKVRCPGCGTIMAVPSPGAQKVSVSEAKRRSSDSARRGQEEAEEESVRITRKRPPADARASAASQDADDSVDSSPLDRDDEGAERHRRRKKKKKRSFLFMPLVTLFGINLTPLKLIILGAVFCMAGVGAFLYYSAAEAQVKVVDVYNMSDDLGEFTTGGVDFDFVLEKLFHKQTPTAFVVREHRDGGFLMVKFKISERTLKKLLGPNQKYENFVMKKKDVVLQGDDDPVYPLFLFEHDYNAKQFVVKQKKLLGDDDEGKQPVDAGEVIMPHQKPVSPSGESPWNHKGLLDVNPAGKSTFEGVHGMKVTFDHGPLPSKEIKVTWDPDSFLRMGVKEEDVASEIWLYDWRITCLFPRPASTKHLKLTVLGKPLKMDYP